MSERGSILLEAHQLVTQDRAEAYGDPREDMERAAKGISMVVGAPVAAWQVPLIMAQVKISRLCHRRTRDSWRDLAGYADVGAGVECESEECEAPDAPVVEVELTPWKCVCVAAQPERCLFIRHGQHGICTCACHDRYAEGGHAAWQADRGIRVSYPTAKAGGIRLPSDRALP